MNHQCPLCDRDACEVLCELPASITSESRPLDGKSALHLCPACGHLFTQADVDWHTYYSSRYDATLTDDGLDELVSPGVFRTDFDYGLFKRMVGEDLHGAARVLEFGFGRGRILSRLKKDGFRRIWACDLSERYRPYAASLLGPERVFIGAIPQGPFHVIASFFVLEHDTDPLDSLRKLRAELSDGGTLFVMVPNWRTNLGDLACADHQHHFSIESLHMLFAAAGLGITGMDVSLAGTVAVTAKRQSHMHGFDNPRLADANRVATKPFIETLSRLVALPSRLGSQQRVFLYGAGFYAALANAFVPKVSGIYDANPRKQGLERLGHTVAAPSTIKRETHAEDCLLVCVNARAAGQIAEQYKGAFGSVLTL